MKRFRVFKGRRVRLDSPRYIQKGEPGYGRKKFVVFADLGKGKTKRVTFGAPGYRIKKNNPVRRKAYRSRAKCSTRNDKSTASYWSCKKW
jgi:hypothetical protein